MQTCPACHKTFPSAQLKCPRCMCYQPSLEEIALWRESIQATWSRTEEAQRRQIKQHSPEIDEVHQHPRGRRVMREGCSD